MQHYRKSHFIKTQDDCILSVLSIYQTQTSKDRELFLQRSRSSFIILDSLVGQSML